MHYSENKYLKPSLGYDVFSIRFKDYIIFIKSIHSISVYYFTKLRRYSCPSFKFHHKFFEHEILT